MSGLTLAYFPNDNTRYMKVNLRSEILLPSVDLRHGKKVKKFCRS